MRNGSDDYPFIITSDRVHTFSMCYSSYEYPSKELMSFDEVLNNALPKLYVQILVILVTSRAIHALLKPFYQIRFAAEMIAALLLSYSGFGQFANFQTYVFPVFTLDTLETIANYALIYHVFLIGLETDISFVTRVGKKALSIAISGIVVPAATGTALFFAMKSFRQDIEAKGFIFWAIALTITSFPELARVLADQKLLYTDIGRTAISSGIINDLSAWVFLIFTISCMNNGYVLGVIIPIVFALACYYVIRPAILWLIKATSEGEIYEQHHYCFVVAGISLFSIITDALGMYPFIGGLAFGLMIPNGPLKNMVIETLQDMVSGLLFPLYYMTLALKMKLKYVAFDVQPMVVVPIIGVACLVKIVSTFLVSSFQNMSAQESWALGVLLNTKGVLAVIVLEAGRQLLVLDFQTYCIMMLSVIIMTFIVGPIVAITKKPTKRFRQFKPRSILKMKPDEEFIVLAGIHSTRDVMGTINILESSNATKNSPITVFAVHLVELTGRASAMLIVHDSCGKTGENNPNRAKSESENIISAFENYERNRGALSAQLLTAVSPYATMHEDICSLVEDKAVHLILLPFHKQPAPDGRMEEENPCLRTLNQNVLENALCSVGIFIDRRLGLANRTESTDQILHFAMFFFGGPDDREALAYAWRMAGHPDICLTVVRCLPGKDFMDTTEANMTYNAYEKEKQLQLDSASINQFKFNSMNDHNISYHEKVVNNAEETLAALRALEATFDMYIVGRRQGVLPALTLGLSEWSDCPELGALGDTLVSSDFSMHASVLVIQQYERPGMINLEGNQSTMPEAFAQVKEQAPGNWNK